jgi:DnaJ-class molecular chaperone
MKSPYEVLEIDATASPEQIKSAYRRKAKQYHPDRNQGDDTALEKFREVQEAYETLTKPQPQNDPFSDFGFSGFDFGGFSHAFRRRNHDLQGTVGITLEEILTGCQRTVSLGDEVMTIDIKAGTHPGTRICLDGKGGTEHADLPAGDLYLNIVLMPHDVFQYDGPNLHMLAEIDLMDLVLGGKVSVKLLNGEDIEVNITQGSQLTNRLRVKGKGLPYGNQVGDLFITLKANTPSYPDDVLDKIRKVINNECN